MKLLRSLLFVGILCSFCGLELVLPWTLFIYKKSLANNYSATITLSLSLCQLKSGAQLVRLVKNCDASGDATALLWPHLTWRSQAARQDSPSVAALFVWRSAPFGCRLVLSQRLLASFVTAVTSRHS